MRVVTKEEFNLEKDVFIKKIEEGAIFIYGTDTIYGISCNAMLPGAVKKIRQMKASKRPFSIEVPNKEWIMQNCVITKKAEEWLEKLPGPYTLILKLKTKIPEEVNTGIDSIGVRIPKHWFHKIVEELGFPIITTSVNKTGKEFMNSLEKLDTSIKSRVGFMINEGEKKARPSTIVNLEKDETQIKER